MSYLYGDSTQSTLDVNYIEYLRESMDLMVAILRADYQARTTQEKGITAKTAAETELERLHDFSAAVTEMIEREASNVTSGATGRCVATVRASSTEAIRHSANQIKAAVQAEISGLEGQMKRDRASCEKSIEAFLLRHDLPGSVHRLELRLSGDHYRARLSGSSKEGLSWVLDLEIPPGNLFSSPVRLDRVVDHLEIKVPTRKKLRSHKLTNKYIIGLVLADGERTIKLRTGPAEDAGFDVQIVQNRVHLLFSGRGEGDRFDPDVEDAAKLIELSKVIFDSATAIRDKRVALVDARIDGKALSEHDNPAVLVQRMVARMAPTVQEISRHSLSPTELVLKRVVGDSRREEIFVAKADLLKKLDPIPLGLRGVFAPLGLGNLETGAPPLPPISARPGPSKPPPPAPTPFQTGPNQVAPRIGTDDETTVTVGPAANGTITIQAEVPDPPRRPPPPSRLPKPADKSDEQSVDAALEALESEG